MFRGSFTALATPFKNGLVDYEGLSKLIEFQIKNGTNGLVPCGSTGESATLSHQEHEEVIRFTIEMVKKRVPVIAGSGSNSTQEALQLTKSAAAAKADAALVISPYYNKPTQKGIYEHYKYLNDNADIPIILYNVPGRTARNMEAETTVALSKLKNIVGMKEASGDLVQVAKILRDAPQGFLVLSGEDALTYPMLAMGAQGAISVTSNIAPKECAQMINSYLSGDREKSLALHLELLGLSDSLFIETNPIPVKEALALMGFMEPDLRLPLTRMLPENLQKLKAVLKEYKLI